MPPTLLLSNAFAPKEGSSLFSSLRLYSDRIEVRRLGMCVRVVPLSSVENVAASSWGSDEVNLRIDVRDEAPIVGRVAAVLAWKYKLMELLGIKERPHALADAPLTLAKAA